MYYQDYNLSSDLEKNIQSLKNIFKDCEDVIFKPIKIGGKINAEFIFIEEMVDVDAYLIKPLVSENLAPNYKIDTEEDAYNYVKNTILSSSKLIESDDLEKVIFYILSGFTALLYRR